MQENDAWTFCSQSFGLSDVYDAIEVKQFLTVVDNGSQMESAEGNSSVWWLHETELARFFTRNRVEGEELGGTSNLALVSRNDLLPDRFSIYLEVVSGCYNCFEGFVQHEIVLSEDEEEFLESLSPEIINDSWSPIQKTTCPRCNGHFQTLRTYRVPDNAVVDNFVDSHTVFPGRLS